jgi:hypothetical protein
MGGFASSVMAEGRQIQAAPPFHKTSGQRKSKFAYTDTLLWFAAEDGGGSPTWNDRITGQPWTIRNLNVENMFWHVDTFNVCKGDSAWWCGDPSVGTSGGYLDYWYQILTSPPIPLPADADSVYLIYNHWLRCEENLAFPRNFSWDGYNVRVGVGASPDYYSEILPYHLEDDSSYYKPWFPWQVTHEYDSLYCWNHFGESGGGFSQDTSTACSQKIFDLRPFAGDIISIRFVFGSDFAYSTNEDSSWFGLILDDILVVEGMDSTTLANRPVVGGDTLFYEDCEGSSQMIPSALSPTGSWWWLAAGGYDGSPYRAWNCDSTTGKYVSNLEDMLISPEIAKADLSPAITELWLHYYLRGNLHDDDEFPDVDWVHNLYRLDDGPWRGISLLNCESDYVLLNFNDDDWWSLSDWDEDIRNLTTLIDSTWETMQVAILLHSDDDEPGINAVGLKLDDITISSGPIYRRDIGVTAAKIPSPNANDVQLDMDTIAVTNYDTIAVGPGDYLVKMTITDSTGAAVFGPGTIVSEFPTPQIDPMDTVKVLLDTSVCHWTLVEEGNYTFRIWTECIDNNVETNPANDTLKNDAGSFPMAHNYPAGTGELRYHDQDFYSYAYYSVEQLYSGEIAAVRFTPDARLYPFDLKWIDIMALEESYPYEYYLLVYGPGDETQPGPLWASIPFSISTYLGDKVLQRIDVDTISALRNLSSEFWVGVKRQTKPPPQPQICYEEWDPDVLGEWGHSYFYNGSSWEKREWDWIFTAGISFQVVFPEVEKAGDNLHLEWDDVSQAAKYYVHRDTNPYAESPALFDSTTVSHYTDPGVVGVAGGYYYWFHTVHLDGIVYDKLSENVGEFGRQLSNGSEL